MSDPEDSDRIRARDEVLAAEYALGVLSFGDRKRLEARIEREPGFARLVARWDEHLAPLETAGEESPPAHVYQAVEQRLFAGRPSPAQAGWWHSLALWRGLAFASMAALVVFASVERGWFGRSVPPQPLVAAMTGEASPLTLLAHYNPRSGRLVVTPAAAQAEVPRSLELWVVPGGNAAPVAIGVLSEDGQGAIDVPENLRAHLGEGVTLALSVEPVGGSPTGQPTGPVIAAGQARHP